VQPSPSAGSASGASAVAALAATAPAQTSQTQTGQTQTGQAQTGQAQTGQAQTGQAAVAGLVALAMSPPAPGSKPAVTVDPVQRILFAAEQTALPDAAMPQLTRLASTAQESGRRLIVVAYAGPVGNDASRARRRSLERATAVRAVLIERGLASTRIDVRAMGVPLDPDSPDRVEVSLGPIARPIQQGAR